MDINELIDNLRFPSWYDLEDPDATLLTDAATALSTLQAENEKLRAELERMKEIMRYNGIMVIPLKYPGGRSEEYSEATRLEGGLTMERLTERLENGIINVKYASQHETAIHRLVTIEDILGDEYDLDRLRGLVQADREGRCVVIHPNSVTDNNYKIICRKINAEDIHLRKMRNAYEKHK